jgi:hypothetical protein
MESNALDASVNSQSTSNAVSLRRYTSSPRLRRAKLGSQALPVVISSYNSTVYHQPFVFKICSIKAVDSTQCAGNVYRSPECYGLMNVRDLAVT